MAERFVSQTPVEFVDLQAQRRRLGPGLETAIARVLEHGRSIIFVSGKRIKDDTIEKII